MTRLIDADEMVKSLMDMTFYDEEGHIIDDYEDRLAIVKSFVDPVQTVDAIPIDFIEKKIDEYREKEDQTKDEPLSGYFDWVRTSERRSLEWLLLEWKAEREQNDS